MVQEAWNTGTYFLFDAKTSKKKTYKTAEYKRRCKPTLSVARDQEKKFTKCYDFVNFRTGALWTQQKKNAANYNSSGGVFASI
jgi:hypothetical protein